MSMTVTQDADRGITVEHAEAVEWFSRDLLRTIEYGGGPATLEGGILTIMAKNGTWRYQITATTDFGGNVQGVLLGVDEPIELRMTPEAWEALQ